MKSMNWNGLYDNNFKSIGLIFAAIFIVIEIVGKITRMPDTTSTGMNIYLIIVSLFLAMFSKEKIEDERILIIRYFALKQTFTIVIVVISITSARHFNFSYYSIIASMLCYFPIFQLANSYNPDFIFKERTSKMSGSFVKGFFVFMTIAAIYDLVMHIFK